MDQQKINARKSRQAARQQIYRSYSRLAVVLLIVYLFGLGSGYGLWGQKAGADPATQSSNDMAQIVAEIYPEGGYTVPAHFGHMGPQMAAAGVFDVTEFEQVYQQANRPLDMQQLAILREGSDSAIVFTEQNAYFLLNYFWAVGLSNQNAILDSGPIQQASQGQVENFASTGGWTLAKKPLSEIYSKLPLVTLTEQQQKNLEETSQAVYRPCCDNSTHFPDCNHGMAMLGLLAVMASEDASVDQMLEAAKYANAYWYPAQTVEQAIYFKSTTGESYAEIDASLLLSSRYSSGSGYQALRQYLVQNNLLPQAPNSGSSCGV